MTITFITAVGPYHTADLATAQVGAQTVPCQHIVIHDEHGRGPGWARNQGLAQTTTEFVAFLDADDLLAPTWAADTLAAFEQHGGRRYIYTDHLQDGKVIEAPNVAWVNETWHVITALLPTRWAQAVGGFDTTLPAFEDTAFYLAMLSSGYCGQRLAKPLFTYGAGGRRSATHTGTPAHDAAMRYFSRQFGGYHVGGCCGDPQPGDLIAIGEHLDGDVMAEAQWAGNRPQRGRATGRVYRTGNWKRTWVDPGDVALDAHLWRTVKEAGVPDFEFADFADYAATTGDDAGPKVGVEEISAFFMREATPAAPPPEPLTAPPHAERPSAATLRTKAASGRRRAGRKQAGAGQTAKGASA